MGRLIDRLVGRSVGWSVGRSVSWSVGRDGGRGREGERVGGREVGR